MKSQIRAERKTKSFKLFSKKLAGLVSNWPTLCKLCIQLSTQARYRQGPSAWYTRYMIYAEDKRQESLFQKVASNPFANYKLPERKKSKITNRRQAVLEQIIQRIDRNRNKQGFKSLNKRMFAIKSSLFTTNRLEELLHLLRDKDDEGFSKLFYWHIKDQQRTNRENEVQCIQYNILIILRYNQNTYLCFPLKGKCFVTTFDSGDLQLRVFCMVLRQGD